MTATRSQPPPRRLLTWLISGPPGHLYGALADLLTAVLRSLRARPQR